jgi:sulfur relay (sulfurtransferase) complex TusBCD TusD component (DsrE family)
MEQMLSLLEWPAMAASLMAAWLVASTAANRRMAGFWIFLVSNGLWIAWGWQDSAWALIILNVCLAAMNVRGILKNESRSGSC